MLSLVVMDALLDSSARPAPVRRAFGYQRLADLVAQPHAALLIAGLAFVLSLPALAIGLTADDFDLALRVTEDPLGAYAFRARDPAVRMAAAAAARDAGSMPWWADLELHQAFFRPLSSLSLALDFALWPNAPWLMHLENSLLFAAIVVLAGSLYGAFGLPVRARGMATLFFAMHGGQSMTTGWISGRNTLLAILFGLLAVRLFVAAQSGRRTLLLSVLAFAASLLSAEAGVAALSYMFAYAHIFGASAPPAQTGKLSVATTTPGLRRWAALWGFGVVLALYLCAYKLGGYGVKNSGFYLDPAADPLRFLLNLFCAIPIYLASQLTLPFAGGAGSHALALPILAALSLAILYVSRGLWWPWVKGDARGRALGLGALLAILPLGSTIPQDRLVSFIALGVCGLVALIVDERLGTQGSQLPVHGARRLFRYHAFWGPALYVPFLFGSTSMIAGGGGMLLDLTLGSDTRPVLLVNAPSFLPTHFFARKRAWYGEARPEIDVLYSGSSEIELTRSAAQSLEVSVPRGYFANTFEQIERDPRRRPLQVGQVIQTQRMRAQVLAVREGAPTRVRFDLEQPLESARVYTWQGRTVTPLTVPKLGQRTLIRAASTL